MKAKISIHGIECYGYHGCVAEEGKVGNRYWVDVDMYLHSKKRTDYSDIKDTVDYGIITEYVHREMKVPSALIEHVAWRIVEAVRELNNPNLKKVRVKLYKEQPPMPYQTKHAVVCLTEKM